jgi:RNA polymerase sigma-70 factor (ECF subfamily)
MPGNAGTPAVSNSAETKADPRPPSDRELIAKIVAGDTEKFEVLMDRYADRAYQIAYGILGQRDDAEEVTQDAFVRIFRALSRFRGDSEFSTWMYRIVVNQARNRYRWNRRRGMYQQLSLNQPLDEDGIGTLTHELPDQDKTPDVELICREWHSEIAREVENLPEVNREALILRNVKNMSYERIAEILGCRVGTVKSRIARAREELRKRMGL